MTQSQAEELRGKEVRWEEQPDHDPRGAATLKMGRDCRR